MRKKMIRYAVLLAICTPAVAVATEKTEEPSDLDRVICKRDNVIGSRVQKKRTCLTQREWTKLQKGTRDGMEDFLKRATQPERSN